MLSLPDSSPSTPGSSPASFTGSGGRRTRRWHQCLSVLKAPGEVNKFAARNGWKAHEAIQRDFPQAQAEKLYTFSDPSLPFDIGYHPDLYDAKRGVLYEIKPVKWFNDNQDYCKAQLAGYMHFTGAKGLFLLYETADRLLSYVGHPAVDMPAWEQLRDVALKSDAMLLEQGK